MTILFYSVSDRKNRLSKTLGTATSLTGTLREPVSLTDPEILIESATVPAYNYAYISDLGRYYFIESVVAEQYSIYRLRMHVDVLMSYKGLKNGASSTGIYSLNTLISRAESTLMQDGQVETRVPIYGKTDLNVGATVTSGSTWEGYDQMFKSTGSKLVKYVLAFNGYVREYGVTEVPSPLPLAFLLFDQNGFSYLSNQIKNRSVTWSGHQITDAIYYMGVLPIEPIGCTNLGQNNDSEANFNSWGSISLPRTDGGISLPWRYPSSSALKVNSVTWTVTISTPSTVNPARNFAPYHKISLRFRPFGKFELDAGLIFNGVTTASTTFKIRADVDMITGNAALFYGKSSTDIYLGSANVMIKFPISSTSYSMAKVASGALSVIGSAIATVATQGAAAGALAASAINAVSSAIPSTAVTGGDQFIVDPAPVIESYRKTSPDFAVNYLGRPYNAIDYIYNLTGYIEVEKVNIEGTGFGTILDSERIELENILKGGFYA